MCGRRTARCESTGAQPPEPAFVSCCEPELERSDESPPFEPVILPAVPAIVNGENVTIVTATFTLTISYSASRCCLTGHLGGWRQREPSKHSPYASRLPQSLLAAGADRQGRKTNPLGTSFVVRARRLYHVVVAVFAKVNV